MTRLNGLKLVLFHHQSPFTSLYPYMRRIVITVHYKKGKPYPLKPQSNRPFNPQQQKEFRPLSQLSVIPPPSSQPSGKKKRTRTNIQANTTPPHYLDITYLVLVLICPPKLPTPKSSTLLVCTCTGLLLQRTEALSLPGHPQNRFPEPQPCPSMARDFPRCRHAPHHPFPFSSPIPALSSSSWQYISTYIQGV